MLRLGRASVPPDVAVAPRDSTMPSGVSTVTAVPPRPGAPGLYDRLVGPGATPLEEAGAWASASLGAIVGGLLPRTAGQRLLGAVLGFDAFGGAWVNSSRAGRQWLRRAGAPDWEPVAFAALHLHPFLVEATTGRRSWRRAAVAWGLPVLGAAAAVAAARRGSGAGLTAAAFAATAALVGAALAPDGWRWLPSVLAVKLVVGHATPGGQPLGAFRRVEARSAEKHPESREMDVAPSPLAGDVGRSRRSPRSGSAR